ncbi:MAG: S1C family serine protease [Planctomycetota bacterium]
MIFPVWRQPSLSRLLIFTVIAWGGFGGRPAATQDERAVETSENALHTARSTSAARPAIFDPLVFEAQIVAAYERVQGASVGIRVEGRSGSGVVVSGDGLVLSAGHVIGSPGLTAKVILPDGRELEATTLGVNQRRDSGMLRIRDATGLAFAAVCTTGEVGQGDWCLAVGHPGGYQAGRPPVPRIGRILDASRPVDGSARFIHSDCPLIGGDSGGGLFDLEGRLIGIHSRIESDVTSNYHVPITVYLRHWGRLLSGEEWTRGDARLGLFGVSDDKLGARIRDVFPGRPATAAGLRADDIITQLDGERVRGAEDLRMMLGEYRPGDEIELVVRRGEEIVAVRVTLAGPQRVGSRGQP